MRRESPVLPHTNPFANPRPGLLDTIAPFLRFATLVALFTAAGLWYQVAGLRNKTAKAVDAPGTTAQEPTNPATKTAERPSGSSTSAGPAGTTPEPNTRIGRTRDNDDYAKLRGDILPVPATPTDEVHPAIPGLANANGELPACRRRRHRRRTSQMAQLTQAKPIKLLKWPDIRASGSIIPRRGNRAMSTTNRAFIKAYRHDTAQPDGEAPNVAPNTRNLGLAATPAMSGVPG